MVPGDRASARTPTGAEVRGVGLSTWRRTMPTGRSPVRSRTASTTLCAMASSCIPAPVRPAHGRSGGARWEERHAWRSDGGTSARSVLPPFQKLAMGDVVPPVRTGSTACESGPAAHHGVGPGAGPPVPTHRRRGQKAPQWRTVRTHCPHTSTERPFNHKRTPRRPGSRPWLDTTASASPVLAVALRQSRF